jgi:hypothetical protein
MIKVHAVFDIDRRLIIISDTVIWFFLENFSNYQIFNSIGTIEEKWPDVTAEEKVNVTRREWARSRKSAWKYEQ